MTRGQDNQGDVAALREVLAAELAASNHVERVLDGVQHAEAREALLQVLDDARRHVAALQVAIESLDPRQAHAGRSARQEA